MTTPAQVNTRLAMRSAILRGTLVASFLTLGVGGWAASTELSGAVIAPGMLVVDSNIKKVQHPTGGVVGELRVRDGSAVREGDVLLRLDETISRANLLVITKSIDELTARQARLKAEQDGLEAIVFPGELMLRRAEPGMVLLEEEARLFAMRRDARQGQRRQLAERISQLREQIQGLTEQSSAKRRESELLAQELKGVRELWKKNLVQITKVTALERDAARLDGERGTITSSIAQVKGRITETELQILQIDQDLRTEVGRELAEIRGRLSEMVEKRIAAQDQLKRVDLRAPQDGVVHQLSTHTIGGVIGAGEVIMMIVPKAEALSVEVKVLPQDIDAVRVGQKAALRFSAFNQRTTPELMAEVSHVSPDVTIEQRSGATFYTVRITPPQSELDQLKGLKLIPGMPVEAFIQTGERTVMSYLTKPLIDQASRAWREK